jgi:hypothetical protein
MFIGGSRLGFRFRYPGGEPGPDQYPNGGFEDNISTDWTIVNSRFTFFGGTSIFGVPSPANPTPNPYGSPGDVYGFASGPGFNGRVALHNEGGGIGSPPPDGGLRCIALQSSGTFAGGGGGIFFGPYIYSNTAVFANTGDTIEFYWRAFDSGNTSTNDAFCVRAYAFTKTAPYKTLFLLDQTAPSAGSSTSWAKVERTIVAGEEGAYHFVFICGSFDSTYGRVVGSSLLLDNIKLRKFLFQE